MILMLQSTYDVFSSLSVKAIIPDSHWELYLGELSHKYCTNIKEIVILSSGKIDVPSNAWSRIRMSTLQCRILLFLQLLSPEWIARCLH